MSDCGALKHAGWLVEEKCPEICREVWEQTEIEASGLDMLFCHLFL